MKTIKLNKKTNPRTRIGVDGSTRTIKQPNGDSFIAPNMFKGVDIKGGPANGGYTKWETKPM